MNSYFDMLMYYADNKMVRLAEENYKKNKESFAYKKLNCDNPDNNFDLNVLVPDSKKTRPIHVIASIYSGRVRFMECNCGCGNRYRGCIHMLQAIHYIKDNPELLESDFYKLSFDRLLNIFNTDSSSLSKKLLNMEIILTLNHDYYGINYDVEFKIGEEKLYSTNNKLKAFLEAYMAGRNYMFGAKFTYTNKYKFNKEDQKIIDFFAERISRNNYITMSELKKIESDQISQFLSLLHDRSFTLIFDSTAYIFDHIYEDLPLDFSLREDNSIITLNMDYKNIIRLDSTYEYIVKDNKIYHISYEKRKVLKDFLTTTGGRPVTFAKDKLPIFTSSILPKIRKISSNINADDSLAEIVKINKPINKIYFDYNRGRLTATPVSVYNGQEINIFDKISSISRDYETEREISEYLENNDFKPDEKRKLYTLDDVDKQGLFLEEYIKIQPENFEFMVSDKLKKVNVLKTPTVSSGISLSKDDWLKYDFKIDGIEEKDLVDLMDAINYKKKYVKLKSGNIIKLDHTEELEQLNDFLSDLDINYKNLDSFELKIPKYKALYLKNRMEKEQYIDIADNFKEFVNNFEKYKNSQIEINDKYDKLLRDYQVTGVNFLTQLSKCGFGGILADEMGLGKTFQAITYIKHSIKENKNRKYLIVSPTSLLYNWKVEFQKFAPDLTVEIINMTPNVRHEKIANLSSDVLITSYGLIRQDIEEYSKQDFDTCIIDEAQTIKNVNAGVTKALKLINAKNRFALTGTPIENSLSELYSIFDFLMPGYFSTLNKFNENYQRPIIKDGNEKVLNKLNMMVRPFILRRKKVDVADDLPAKLEKRITIELDDESKKIYLTHLKLAKKEFEDTIKNGGFEKNQIKILAILTRLRQICISPSLFMDNYHGISSKMQAVLDIVKSARDEGHKILLFSSFKTSLQIFGNILTNENINYYYIDGQTKSKDRLELVNKFNNDQTPIFLISLKAGGVGLNLTGADIVIHLDFWWNPAVEAQATDRAHRIGQTKVVEVIKVVCQGTIEERVLELQEKKKKISNSILEVEDIDKAILSKLTEKDIKGLLGM